MMTILGLAEPAAKPVNVPRHQMRNLRMAFGIGGDADLERMELEQTFHQLIGIAIAARDRHVLAADAARRIAAQRHDMADAGIPIGIGDGVDPKTQ